jgi:hypothetical protein
MRKDGVIIDSAGLVVACVYGHTGQADEGFAFVETDPARHRVGDVYAQRWEGMEGAVAWLAARVEALEAVVPASVEPRERPGFLIQTRVAELSTRIDHVAEDKIAAHYPIGRVAELEVLVHQAEIKTHDGVMPSAEELAAEEEYRRYSAYREATLTHAQGLKNAVLMATTPQLDEIEAGLEEGWPDVGD